MPVYEYEHAGPGCKLGKVFEIEHSIAEAARRQCPLCGEPIVRLISRPFISAPTSDSDLKSMGFTKLVKRETGVYENVTRLPGESRYMEAGKPDTTPHIRRRVSD